MCLRQASNSEINRPWFGSLLLQKALKLVGPYMNLPRRKFLRLAAGAAALPAVSRAALALDYPNRPVKILVGFSGGGAVDVVARLIGDWLSRRLGAQFLVEDRPGAANNIATEDMIRSPADGYTLLLTNPTNAINATYYAHLSYDF